MIEYFVESIFFRRDLMKRNCGSDPPILYQEAKNGLITIMIIIISIIFSSNRRYSTMKIHTQ